MNEDQIHFLYLLKNLPTCLTTLFENDDLSERSEEVATALMTCFAVYHKKYGFTEFRNFRTKQIVQIYKLLFNEDNEHVKCAEIWRRALILEEKREKEFVMNAMTTTTRDTFLLLMEKYRVPPRRWYLFLNLLLDVQEHMEVLPNGHIELPPGSKMDDVINKVNKDKIQHTQIFAYSLLKRLQILYPIREIVKVLSMIP